MDRFGLQVEPREWFLVPLAVIEEAIQKIKEGTIDGFPIRPGNGASDSSVVAPVGLYGLRFHTWGW